MAFSLLGNKIGGINDITANHQCAFKPGYGTFAEKPAYQPQQHALSAASLPCRLCQEQVAVMVQERAFIEVPFKGAA